MQITESILSVILISLVFYELYSIYKYGKRKKYLEETVEKYGKQIYLNHKSKTQLENDYRNKCLELSITNNKLEEAENRIRSLRQAERKHKHLIAKLSKNQK